jgi:hypothetical protein
MAASITNTHQIITTSKPHDSTNPSMSGDDKQKNKPSFGLRIASVILMVIPHIVTHIGLGAAKGLEVGLTRPAEFLNRHNDSAEASHSTY